MIGRSRSTEASSVAVAMSLPSRRSLLMNEYESRWSAPQRPSAPRSPNIDDNAEISVRNPQRSSPPTGSVTITLKKMMAGISNSI